MARPKNPNAQNIDELFAQAEQEEQSRQSADNSEPKKRGRPKGQGKPALSKEALASLFQTANFGCIVMGQGEYALTPPEIEALTNSWYDVLVLYPKVASMLIVGNSWTAWGGAIVTTYMVVSKRVEYYNDQQRIVKTQNPPGSALHHNGNERNGQDDVSQTADVFQTVSDSPGF